MKFWIEKIKTFIPKAHEFALTAFIISVPLSKAVAECLLILSIVLWAARKIILGEPWFRETGYSLILLAFLVSSSFSLFGSENLFESMRGMLKLLRHLLIFFMVVDTFRTEEGIARLVKLIIAGWLIVLLDGVWQYHYGFDLIRRAPIDFSSVHIRIGSSLKNFGIFAAFILFYIPLFISIALTKSLKKTERVLGLILLVLSLVCLYHTHSRGAWIASALAILFFGVISGRKIIIFLVVAASLTAVLLMPRSVLIHLDIENKEQSVVERFVLWQRALDVIAARPLFGIGINTYSISHKKYDKHQSYRVRGYYAHNGYLQMAAETGLVTLGIFLFFIARLFLSFIKSLRCPVSEPKRVLLFWLASGLFGFLAYACADTILHNKPTLYLFWFMCGLAVAVMRLSAISPQPSAKENSKTLS
ncbi:MAG: O-antigen ligase family protein [Candidatus Omnitrophica bacterium]|nr:O-antigen ligase family protein [Candidatus Omnitrophota bacterium]